MLIEPPDPDEVAAKNADCDEPDGPLLDEDETAAALFTYLVNESDDWQSGAAHQVAALTEPEALGYLLARGPLRPHENRALITAFGSCIPSASAPPEPPPTPPIPDVTQARAPPRGPTPLAHTTGLHPDDRHLDQRHPSPYQAELLRPR